MGAFIVMKMGFRCGWGYVCLWTFVYPCVSVQSNTTEHNSMRFPVANSKVWCVCLPIRCVVLVAGAFQLKRAYELLAMQEDVVSYLSNDDVRKAAVSRTLKKILTFGSESKCICCVLAQACVVCWLRLGFFGVQGRAHGVLIFSIILGCVDLLRF